MKALWCSVCPGASEQPIEFKTGRARSSWQQDILETDSHDVNAVWGSACCNVTARLTHAWSGALGVRACRVISCHIIVKGAKSLRPLTARHPIDSYIDSSRDASAVHVLMYHSKLYRAFQDRRALDACLSCHHERRHAYVFLVSIIGIFSEQARRCRCVWQYTTKLTITSPLSIPHCFGSSNTKYSIPRKHSTIPAFMWMPACGPCHKTTETNSPLLCAAQPEKRRPISSTSVFLCQVAAVN